MYALFLIMSSMGYGAWYDGVEENKAYFGVYSPTKDYGLVYDIEHKDLYCDIVWTKTN
jgi:hypothetical protein